MGFFVLLALYSSHRDSRFDTISGGPMLTDVNALGLDYNKTPLHAASKGGRVGSARVLLEHGADVNVQDDDKWTRCILRLRADM